LARRRALLVARERIALLEAVMEHKSITKAAEITGFSYKTAWDAVNAINNLLPRPAFITRTGGSHGGGAEVTNEGRRLILTFRRLEEKLGRISTAIAAEGLEYDQDLGIGLKLSVRNALFCKVVKITRAPINIEVKLEVSPVS
jgi:molybdate transport system regulatory protein